MRRRAALVASALALLLAGCAAGERALSATGGVTIEMLVERGEGSHARYLVDDDGVLHFAGGLDAIQGTYRWRGALTEGEISQLRALLERHRWLEEDPHSTGEPPDLRHEIRVRGGGRRRSFEVIGDGPGVAAFRELLEAAGRRRHEPILRALPKAGERH